MIDSLIFQKNNDYLFDETIHTYYWKGKKVNTSVTKFIERYFNEFDTETISARYAQKHGLLQEDVKKMWKQKGDISAMAGTVIHAYLENMNRGKLVPDDFTPALNEGIETEVRDRVKILKPKAEAFINSIHNKLIPLAMEYTVGHEDKLAGNIDMLAWNNKAQEIQIWDYKNTKGIEQQNKYQKCHYPFEQYDDCNFIHYSLQVSTYKAMAEDLLGIKIGKMYLVHFNYNNVDDNFEIYEVIDFSNIMREEINKL